MAVSKILIVAYVFPPIAYAGTYRTLRFCRELSRMGYNIWLLTIKEQPDIDNDFSLIRSLPPELRVVRTPTIDPWRVYQKIKRKLLMWRVSKLLDKAMSTLLFLINQPDHMIMWVPFAVIKGYLVMRKEKIKTVYTTSPPHSEQLIGWLLKKITGCKWIADLRDPVFDNVASVSWGVIEKRVHMWLERIIIKNADCVVCNTRKAKEAMEVRYPGKRTVVIHNSFDEHDFKDLIEKKYSKFTIAHIGSIYHFRKVDSFFEAIKKLDEKGVINPERFQVLFVGLNDKSVCENARKYRINRYIDVRDIVPHDEALKIMSRSHLLLLIKGFGPNSAGQIPGKLFEYLATGNRVLCIAPRNCEAAEIIEMTAAGEIVEDDADQIFQNILNEYLIYTSVGYSDVHQKREAISSFSSENMSRRLHEVILAISSEDYDTLFTTGTQLDSTKN